MSSGSNATINGSSYPVTYSSGGAINNSGSLTITQSVLENNVAAGLYSYGGAIYNAGSLNLSSSTLSANEAVDAENWGGGGAVYNAATGHLNVTNSTFVNNAVTTMPRSPV